MRTFGRTEMYAPLNRNSGSSSTTPCSSGSNIYLTIGGSPTLGESEGGSSAGLSQKLREADCHEQASRGECHRYRKRQQNYLSQFPSRHRQPILGRDTSAACLRAAQ